MKAFVIEYFDEKDRDRLERKQFWEAQIRRWTGRIEIVLSKQERRNYFLVESDGSPFNVDEYDLLLIHASDMNYAAGQSYVELAKHKGKPFVCYSDQSKIDVPALEKCQIGRIPLKTIRTNIDLFFQDVVRRGSLCPESFYLLAGINPKLEAALDLLYLFLPLDIELQLKDGTEHVEKCKALSCKLRAQDKEVARLVWAALGIEFDPSMSHSDISAVPRSNGKAAVDYLVTLLTQVDRICKEDINSTQLSEIFGQQVDEEGEDIEAEGDIGFHQTYKDFRDQLLASVHSNLTHGR